MLVKEYLDKEDVPFYKIDFVLATPSVGDSDDENYKSIGVKDFLYKDIYEEKLEERIKIGQGKWMDSYEN